MQLPENTLAMLARFFVGTLSTGSVLITVSALIRTQ